MATQEYPEFRLLYKTRWVFGNINFYYLLSFINHVYVPRLVMYSTKTAQIRCHGTERCQVLIITIQQQKLITCIIVCLYTVLYFEYHKLNTANNNTNND